MAEHAKLSPSSAHRWFECPGSVAATEGMDSPETVYSREGTFAHSVAAKLLREDSDARDALGYTDNEFTVDAEMAKHLQTYVDSVRGVQLVEGGDLLVEQQVRVSADVWGTADALVVTDKVLHVFDLKFGAGISVPVVDNPQLFIYGLGGLALLGLNTGLVDGVHHYIVQPRRPDPDGGATRSHFATSAEVEVFRRRLAAATIAAKQPDAPLRPGDWCQFCPAAGNCPALRQKALSAAQAVFPDLDALKPVKRLPSVTNLSPAEVGKVLSNLDLVDTWTKALRDHAYALVTAGTPVPGWKLVERIGHRKWIDEPKAAQALKKFCDPFEHSLKSPAQIEKSNKSLKTIVEELTHRPVTGVSLVPESDKRPAVRGRPEDVFPVLE